MISINTEIQKTISAMQAISDDAVLISRISEIAEICTAAIYRGNKIFFCGNGGSAADAQHLAAEFVSKLNYDRPGMAAIALTVDTSALTAIGNDYGFYQVFSRQIEALAKKDDVLIAISTSGNSQNIINAIMSAKKRGMRIIGKTGRSGGKMADLCDVLFRVPSDETQKIQECHIMAGHIYAGIVEERVFPK